MKNKTLLLTFTTSLVLAGCGGNTDVKPSSSDSQPVTSKNTAPAAETNAPTKTVTASSDDGSIHVINVKQLTNVVQAPGMISSEGLTECHLQSVFPELFTAAAAEHNITVNLVDKINSNAKGYNLDAEYTQIIDKGNPFIGHYKFTALHVTLYKNGKKVAAADFGRNSGGGFFGGFKGSCSVLGRTVKANAEDIARWLEAPVDGARVGNL